MSVLEAIAGMRGPDVVGSIEQGRMDVLARQAANQRLALGNVELAKAATPPRMSFKDMLGEMEAKSSMQFKIADTLLHTAPEKRESIAANLAPGLTDLSDDALSNLRSEAVYGMDAVGEFGKAEQDAAMAEARGDSEGAAAIRQAAKDKYSKPDKLERVELFDRADPTKSFWVTKLPNGKLERDGRILTEQELDRYTEKGVSRSETGGVGDFSKKEGADFREYEATTASVLGLTKRIREQAAEGGAGIMGVVGGAQSLAAGTAAQVMAAAKALGGKAEAGGKTVSEESLMDASLYAKEIESSFGVAGAKNAALRSNIIDLAYTLARAKDPGGRLSDKDVKFQIERIASHGDPKQLSAVLDEVEADLVRSFDIRASIFDKTRVGAYKTNSKTSKTKLQSLEAEIFGK